MNTNQNWTEGYVTDVGYTYGYYGELNPLIIRLLLTCVGYASPDVVNACELGFGQGLSINIHASASNITWSGTDFNPSQANFAQELERLSGNDAKLFDQSFAQYCLRDDLPDFDYIGLHGIWSWISDENRSLIVNFIEHKLKVGGVLYVSYNTQPGWAAMIPLRDLMTSHAQVFGGSGLGMAKKIESALSFTEKLFETKPQFSVANPKVEEQFNRLKTQNQNYLAHEYFNRDWMPMPFSKMTEWLAPAKLQFGCSANYLDHVDAINLTPQQQNFLKDIADPYFRESTRDFMVNTQFRKDFWVKGVRKLLPLEQVDILRNQKIMLIKHTSDISLKIQAAIGEVTLSEAIYKPLLDILSDYKPKSIGQIELAITNKGITFNQLIQAVIVLCGLGAVSPMQEDSVVTKVKKISDKLNQALISKSRGTGELSYLASPMIGGGVPVGRVSQLFLLAIAQGKKSSGELSQFVWNILDSQGQKILKDGKALATPQENLDELLSQANTFAEKQLPILKALQIA